MKVGESQSSNFDPKKNTRSCDPPTKGGESQSSGNTQEKITRSSDPPMKIGKSQSNGNTQLKSTRNSEAKGHTSNLDTISIKPLTLSDIIGDGNCLFRAFALATWNDQNKHKHMRRELVDTIIKHDLSDTPNETGKAYLDRTRMNHQGTWGTDIEIYAYCIRFNTEVKIFHTQSKEWLTFNPDLYGKQRNTINNTVLLQHKNNHFQNVLQTINSETNLETMAKPKQNTEPKNIKGGSTKHNDMLKIYYCNARGILTKINSLKTIIVEHNPDLVAITETWLKDKGPEIDNYTWIQANRQEQIKGGGIGVLVKNSILNRVEGDSDSTYRDQIQTVKLKRQSEELLIHIIYAPQDNAQHNERDNFYENLNKILCKTDNDSIILGDFNAKINDDKSTNGKSLINTIKINKLTKKCDNAPTYQSNHCESKIDYCLSKNENHIIECNTLNIDDYRLTNDRNENVKTDHIPMIIQINDTWKGANNEAKKAQKYKLDAKSKNPAK